MCTYIHECRGDKPLALELYQNILDLDPSNLQALSMCGPLHPWCLHSQSQLLLRAICAAAFAPPYTS